MIEYSEAHMHYLAMACYHVELVELHDSFMDVIRQVFPGISRHEIKDLS